MAVYREPTPPMVGQSLLDGSYDEEKNEKEFKAAVQKFRQQNKQQQQATMSEVCYDFVWARTSVLKNMVYSIRIRFPKNQHIRIRIRKNNVKILFCKTGICCAYPGYTGQNCCVCVYGIRRFLRISHIHIFETLARTPSQDLIGWNNLLIL